MFLKTVDAFTVIQYVSDTKESIKLYNIMFMAQ